LRVFSLFNGSRRQQLGRGHSALPASTMQSDFDHDSYVLEWNFDVSGSVGSNLFGVRSDLELRFERPIG